MRPSGKRQGRNQLSFVLISWVVGVILCTLLVSILKYYGIYENMSWFQVMVIPLFGFVIIPAFFAIMLIITLQIDRWVAAYRKNHIPDKAAIRKRRSNELVAKIASPYIVCLGLIMLTCFIVSMFSTKFVGRSYMPQFNIEEDLRISVPLFLFFFTITLVPSVSLATVIYTRRFIKKKGKTKALKYIFELKKPPGILKAVWLRTCGINQQDIHQYTTHRSNLIRREQMENKAIKLAAIIAKLVDFCVENHLSIKGEQTSDRLGIMALYDIILELAVAAQLIINNRCCVSSAALLRSLFEYDKYLHWLITYPDQLQQRVHDSQKEQLKMIRDIEISDDDIFEEIKQDPTFDAQKKHLEAETDGHTKQDIYDRCKDLNDLRSYTVIYRPLSQDVHPNMIRVWNRYFPVNDDGSLKMLSPERTEKDSLSETCLLSLEDQIGRLCLVSEVLINSTRRSHQFDSTLTEEIDNKLIDFKNEILNIIDESELG